MELKQSLLNTTYNAYETNNITAGDKVKIETEVSGEDVNLLDTEVPIGKNWELSIQVKVVETNI